MPPKKRSKENRGLPSRWALKHGAYYYLPRDHEKPFFDNKSWFRLGTTLSVAHEAFGRRISPMTPTAGIRTMDMLCDTYMQKAFPLKKVQSRRDIPKRVQTIREVFGHSPVEQVKTLHVYQLYEALKESRGHNTANKHMEVLSDMLSHAIRWGLISVHPMTEGKFKKTRPKTKARDLEDWEIVESLKVAPPLIAAYVELKWLTGLRMTDMLSLRWQDIREDGVHVTSSKTQQSQIFLWSEELLQAVENIRAIKPKVGSMHLFSTRTGQPYVNTEKKMSGFQSIWQRWMKKALSETKLEERYQERHIRNKVSNDSGSVEEASRRLGHSDLATTRKFYRSKPETVTPLRRKK